MGCLGNMTATEKLMALAADWEDRSCGLYVHLREGSEGRWGVNGFSRGSVSEILREIADRAREEQADLKMFAERVHGMLWGDGWHPLDETADRLDEELSELDRMRCRLPEEHEELADGGCYDDEDYAAAMWVREHGGLKMVKGLLDWAVGHCSTKQQLDFDFWLSGRVMHELGFEEDVADRDEVERRLLARLMPEGMEWPRYTDGSHVEIGDEVVGPDYGERINIDAVKFRANGFILYDKSGFDKWYESDDWFERPAPKVLDADGAEIRVGDTVWDIESGIEYEVVGIHTDEDSPVRVMRTDGSHLAKAAKPSTLTHQRPDSWERLEDDAGKNPFDYCKDVGHRLDTCENSEAYKARDLVRRARALAGRDA